MNACIIAIVGGSGSGKSWLAQQLQQVFGPTAGRLSLDDYYRDLSQLPPRERKMMNFDHPNAIDWPRFRRDLNAIHGGQRVALPVYDFATHTRSVGIRQWEPHRLVLLDGLWLLRHVAVRRLCRLKVFVDCPESLRLERRVVRDQCERGRSARAVRAQFTTQVVPNHRRFVAPQMRHADIVVASPITPTELNLIIARCRQFLHSSSAS